MTYDFTNPLIVQTDRTVLLETASPRADEARSALARFADLEKSPEHLHTYRVTAIAVWNAVGAGLDGDAMVATLERFAKYPVPDDVAAAIRTLAGRYGRLALVADGDALAIESDDDAILDEVAAVAGVRKHVTGRRDDGALLVPMAARGLVKQALIGLDYPVRDLAGYATGASLDVALADDGFTLRDYQREAVRAFWADGRVDGGSGVVVLPCGAGKTIVGIGAIAACRTHTLVLTTGRTSVAQWCREIVERTTLGADDVGEYEGPGRPLRPVTVATYQLVTWRKNAAAPFEHFSLFRDGDWGLVIYDEVHLLPAPVFRATAELQARRRLGLTATLVREDGRERDVFSLVGPKAYELPWKALEAEGWIATAHCVEVRVPFDAEAKADYVLASKRTQFRLASENPRKAGVVRALVERHADDRVLVIGAYLASLRRLARALDAPIIAGDTSQAERERLYQAFRDGTIGVLCVSKVANFAVDLPDANVAIEVSGSFGSRQEEAQRLGRLLRPKADGGDATFYALVTTGSREADFGANRQRFLAEQGYDYEVVDASTLVDPGDAVDSAPQTA